MSDRTKQIIFLASAVLFIIIVAVVLVFGLKEPPPKESINLEFWGVYDDNEFFQEAITEYTRLYPNVNIVYRKKIFEDYEKDLIDAFAAERGPDIWSMHNTWLPKHKDKIMPLPIGEGWMTLKEFKDTFVDVAAHDLVFENRIYGLPTYVDTLALYWNKDIFQTGGVSGAPKKWEDFMMATGLLTKRDSFGNIVRSGASMGTSRNINRSTDILSLLMLQTGTKMTDDRNEQAMFNGFVLLEGEPYAAGEEALRFYTDFADPQKDVYAWNPEMDYSIDAFYQGESAMMINYSHHIDTIKNKAPYLNFGVAKAPQIKGRETDITYANFWAPTVSIGSKNPEWAWHFLQFLSSKDGAKKYLKKSGRPTARRDLVDWQKNEVNLGVFAEQSLTARSWKQIDNVAIENIFADMIESVVLGQATPRKAINKAANQVNVLYRK